ncbi:MAG: hypothetical protein LLG20_01850 [Acidobacteriales bacterium]|nr:hypothetical protein [Terriglobales bacterium]
MWPRIIIRGGQPTENLELLRGDSLNAVLEFQEENETTHVLEVLALTGCSARFQIRETADDDTIMLTASTAAGTLIIDEDDGEIAFAVPAASTKDLEPGTYKFDIEVTWPDGVVETMLGPADITVLADVSRT